MEHWPGHEGQERTQTTKEPKEKGKQKEPHRKPSFWRWPHLEHGLIGRISLVSKDGRVQWTSAVDTSKGTRWLPLGRPTKVFPETRSPQVNIQEHSARQRAEKGLQYLRAYFPDADFPGELLRSALEADAQEMRRLKAFNPFIGNMLEVIPSHHTQDESVVIFPMGELGRELNVSPFGLGTSGNMVFTPRGSPSFVFETPILQISSAIRPSEWIASPSSALLIRTYTSSSLLRLERSKVTMELDITRSETGGIPIVDSRILASGPDIIVVNRGGKLYKCNTCRGGKAMQPIRGNETSEDDYFWQLGITGRSDECFLTSCKTVRHFDLRSADTGTDVFSLNHPSALVTSFESPTHDHISRITTTSDVIWLDDRFRRRPLLSFKHYRNFDRTLRVLTTSLSNASFSLLTSRNNSFVTLYDVNRGSDVYDGHALFTSPSGVQLTFLRLSQHGSIFRQDIRLDRPDGDQPESVLEDHVTHQWDEDVQTLERKAEELRIDFGPAGGKHYIEVNLRGAYEKIFAVANHNEDVDENTIKETLDRLPGIFQETEKIVESMLTTLDLIPGVDDQFSSCTNFFASCNINSKQVFDALMCDQITTQRFAGLARWHYNIQDTSIPGLDCYSADFSTFHEYLKELNLVGVEGHNPSERRETEAREQLVLDMALSNDVYSTRPFTKLYSVAAGEESKPRAYPSLYSEEPPEVKFGYFRPIRKAGADHYAEEYQDGEEDPGVTSPLGVRLLLAEWELGTDPEDYTYRDPYGVADIDAQLIPRYRRLSTTPIVAHKKQAPPQRPPLVAVAQPPVVHTVEHASPAFQNPTIQQTHSQQHESRSYVFSQEPVSSTQVLPGRFGGRPDTGKRPTKKRMAGF